LLQQAKKGVTPPLHGMARHWLFFSLANFFDYKKICFLEEVWLPLLIVIVQKCTTIDLGSRMYYFWIRFKNAQETLELDVVVIGIDKPLRVQM